MVSVDKTPIGTGPVQDKYGKAVVETLVGGVETQYAIQAQPVTEEEKLGQEQRSGLDQDQDQSGIRLVQVEPASVLEEENEASAAPVVFATQKKALV